MLFLILAHKSIVVTLFFSQNFLTEDFCLIESFPLSGGHNKIGQFGLVCYILSDYTLHANADFNEVNEVKFAHLKRSTD